MRFDAIVHAPTLRAGARLNIAEADQSETMSPGRMAVGSDVWLRFGTCCPDLSRGKIVGYTDAPERAVLAIDAGSWTLRKGDGGVTTPGLASETWFVADERPGQS